MHQPRSAHATASLKRGGCLYLLTTLVALTAIGWLSWAVYQSDRTMVLYAALTLAGAILLLGLAWFSAHSARCPLCAMPVMLSRRCARNRKARRLLGSFRLRVARDIVFTNKFVCPYCGEPTLCVPRERTRGPR